MTDVNTPSKEHAAFCALAKLPRTLMGGTKAMRAASVTYLPMEAAESATAYAARLNRTTLFNAFRKTVKDMTGKVFDKVVTLEDDVPALIKADAENIDLAGRHLNVFARDVFFDAMQAGIAYILTDMPAPVQREDGKPATIADEQAAGIRPYLCHVKGEDVLGWQTATINGVVTLTQFRILETETVADGEFGVAEVKQVRVLYPGRWEIWREATEGAWEKVREGTTSLNKITIAPVYVNRTGFMTGEPPLEDLADLNVAHWQSQSDQRNILHVARVPILFGAGINDDDKLEIGAASMVRCSNPDADLKYVEHTGAAIDSGNTDIKNLEFQMQTQGLQLLIPNPGQTATGEIRDDSKENSPLAMMARALADALEQSLGFMAEYRGLGEDAGGSVDVNTDFGISSLDVPQVIAAFSAGLIDAQTAVDELKRRGFLSDSVDAEVVMERLANSMKLEASVAVGQGMNLDAGVASARNKQRFVGAMSDFEVSRGA